MTKAQFKKSYLDRVKDCPKEWRVGQSVFNLADEAGWARTVQYQYGIDCFYNDNKIDAFLDKGYEMTIEQNNENEN